MPVAENKIVIDVLYQLQFQLPVRFLGLFNNFRIIQRIIVHIQNSYIFRNIKVMDMEMSEISKFIISSLFLCFLFQITIQIILNI